MPLEGQGPGSPCIGRQKSNKKECKQLLIADRVPNLWVCWSPVGTCTLLRGVLDGFLGLGVGGRGPGESNREPCECKLRQK